MPKSTTKKVKKIKDKHAPKRGKNSFMFFCNDKREELKKEQPDLSFGESGKKLGLLWKEVSVEEKAKYVALASE